MGYITTYLWHVKYFRETFEDNCHFENLILNTSDILFGNSKFDEILHKIMEESIDRRLSIANFR